MKKKTKCLSICTKCNFSKKIYQSDSESDCENSSENPILNNQNDLDDLVSNLLAKDSAELLASRLKERIFLLPETRITFYRKRELQFIKYFSKQHSFVYCHDVKGLLSMYNNDLYNANDWRFFIETSKESLKAVLIHNGDNYAAVPVGHSTILKESFDCFQLLLEKPQYNSKKQLICGDFKMINLLVDLQSTF